MHCLNLIERRKKNSVWFTIYFCLVNFVSDQIQYLFRHPTGRREKNNIYLSETQRQFSVTCNFLNGHIQTKCPSHTSQTRYWRYWCVCDGIVDVHCDWKTKLFSKICWHSPKIMGQNNYKIWIQNKLHILNMFSQACVLTNRTKSIPLEKKNDSVSNVSGY